MSNKKIDIKKYITDFTVIIFLSAILIIYIVIVTHFNDGAIYLPAMPTLDMNFKMNKYNSLTDLFGSEFKIFFFSYVFGLAISGIGWFKESKKRKKAEKDIGGLKKKLSDVEIERDSYKKRYEAFEKSLTSPPAQKKANNKGGGKPKDKKTPMLVWIVFVLIVGGLVGYKIAHLEKDKNESEAYIIEESETIDDSDTEMTSDTSSE